MTCCLPSLISRVDAASHPHRATLSRRPGHTAANTRADLNGVTQLGQKLRVGDLIFTRIPALPFRKVATVTGSWTNHVGVVVETCGSKPMIAESKFPFSRLSPFSEFVARSEGNHVAVARLKFALTDTQRERLCGAAKERLGVLYDTGFNLHSSRQFCSRYVREVLSEASGILLGEVVTFAELLSRQPQSDLWFWRIWYLGRIPWDRETVAPASLLESSHLYTIFDGAVPGPGEHH